MTTDDFKSCAEHSLGDQVHAWDELVIEPLIEFGKWWDKQDDHVRFVFNGVALATLASLIAWLAKIVSVSAAEVIAPIVAAFAVGVGIGVAVNVLIDCHAKL
jgi:hypothetical protein